MFDQVPDRPGGSSMFDQVPDRPGGSSMFDQVPDRPGDSSMFDSVPERPNDVSMPEPAMDLSPHDSLNQTRTLWDVFEIPRSPGRSPAGCQASLGLRPLTAPDRQSEDQRPRRAKGPSHASARDEDHFPSPSVTSDSDRALQKAIERDSGSEGSRGSKEEPRGAQKRYSVPGRVDMFVMPPATETGRGSSFWTADPMSRTSMKRDAHALPSLVEKLEPAPSAPSCAPKNLHSPVRLLIVRHARSANKGRSSDQKASLDPDLSDLGFLQAEALGTRLAKELWNLNDEHIMVASSPMRRCLYTIRPAVHNLKLAKDNCFVVGNFFEFGCAGASFTGSTTKELADDFPEFQPRCFSSAGYWDYRFSSERETEAEARARGVQIVDWIWEVALELSGRGGARSDKVLILCIHQTMADIICQLMVDGTCEGFKYGQLTYKLQNTGITEVLMGTTCDAKFGQQNTAYHLADIKKGPQAPATDHGKKIGRLRVLFRQYDKSGNGRLDFSEMSSLLRKGNPSITDQELWALFTSVDRTRDGEVDFDEFVAYIFSTTSSF